MIEVVRTTIALMSIRNQIVDSNGDIVSSYYHCILFYFLFLICLHLLYMVTPI